MIAVIEWGISLPPLWQMKYWDITRWDIIPL